MPRLGSKERIRQFLLANIGRVIESSEIQAASGGAMQYSRRLRELREQEGWPILSNSYVERQNLTMRMSMRRFTRLTNGFSKKLANLAAAVSLYFMHYNFCRKHQTLKGQTPAMAAGVADHVWAIEEIVALLDGEVSN